MKNTTNFTSARVLVARTVLDRENCLILTNSEGRWRVKPRCVFGSGSGSGGSAVRAMGWGAYYIPEGPHIDRSPRMCVFFAFHGLALERIKRTRSLSTPHTLVQTPPTWTRASRDAGGHVVHMMSLGCSDGQKKNWILRGNHDDIASPPGFISISLLHLLSPSFSPRSPRSHPLHLYSVLPEGELTSCTSQ